MVLPTVVITFFLLNYVRAGVLLTAVTAALAEQNVNIRVIRLGGPHWPWVRLPPGPLRPLSDEVKDIVLERNGRYFRLSLDTETKTLKIVPQGGGQVPVPIDEAVTTALIDLRQSGKLEDLSYLRHTQQVDWFQDLTDWLSAFAMKHLGLGNFPGL